MSERHFDMVVKVYTTQETMKAGETPLTVQPVGIITAPDEWKARTRAMYAFFRLLPDHRLAGQFVDYDVTEVL